VDFLDLHNYQSGTFEACHVIMYTGSSIRVMGSCGCGLVWVGVYHFVSYWLHGQGRLRGFYMRGISVLDEHSQNNK
jgi:hypothetical protein